MPGLNVEDLIYMIELNDEYDDDEKIFLVKNIRNVNDVFVRKFHKRLTLSL
jgi:hypothetical protein